MNGIKHDQLKMLAENGGVNAITIIGDNAGFSINVATLSGDKALFTKAGKMRSFKKMDTLLGYLKTEVGVREARIDFGRWNPAQECIKA